VEQGRGNASADKIRGYRDLRAWQLGRVLVKMVYDLTRQFPPQELYGLSHQIRKAAVSVPSNIAEGYGRGSLRDYVRFLQTARGSLCEVETQAVLAQDLGYVAAAQVDPVWQAAEECARVLQGLIASLRKADGPKR